MNVFFIYYIFVNILVFDYFDVNIFAMILNSTNKLRSDPIFFGTNLDLHILLVFVFLYLFALIVLSISVLIIFYIN